MRTKLLLLLPCFISLVNCATVVRGTTEPFKVITEPPGATVTTSLETKDSIKLRKHSPELTPVYDGCNPTPCEITVPRRSKFVARIEHEGYEPTSIIVRSKAGLGTTSLNSTGTTAATASGLTVAAGSSGVGGFGIGAASLSVGAGAIYATPLIATDAVSGALLSLYPNPVGLKLQPIGTGSEKNYDLDALKDSNETYKNLRPYK